MAVIRLNLREARLRHAIRAQLRQLGFGRASDGTLLPPALDKESYRAFHRGQRSDRSVRERRFLEAKAEELLRHFATGTEVDPARIRPRIERIQSDTWQSDLFRLACALWSVPVSQGFGRRMRFLVWDDHCGRLVGLFALGDPVFNLKVRDDTVGWTGKQRAKQLINVLDAYVVGAVPPYNQILGGKLVATLIRSREVVDLFRRQYGNARGIISRRRHKAQLLLTTTTSALGRSSLYNRLKLDGVQYFKSIGYTAGWGHFHFPDALFAEMRSYLEARQHKYAADHGFGEGPNWRLRAIRKTLSLLELDPWLTRHGLPREVFLSQIADNAFDVLKGKRKRARYDSLMTVSQISASALKRWVQPRAQRDPRYRDWTREHLKQALGLTDAPDKRSIARKRHAQRARQI